MTTAGALILALRCVPCFGSSSLFNYSAVVYEKPNQERANQEKEPRCSVKQLLENYFLEFLELFCSKIAGSIDRRSKIKHVKEEVFVTLKSNKVLKPDLVAEFKGKGGNRKFLVHLEPQSRRKRDFSRRMFLYHSLLHFVHGLPVYQVAVCSYGKPRTREPDSHKMQAVDGKFIVRFKFECVQLNRLKWRKFAHRSCISAAALICTMPIAPRDRVCVWN